MIYIKVEKGIVVEINKVRVQGWYLDEDAAKMGVAFIEENGSLPDHLLKITHKNFGDRPLTIKDFIDIDKTNKEEY